MKPIIEPHIHMIARTTDDYMAMRANGIRVCVEPSFWLGENRRYAGSFFDYFRLSLEFEHTRAARYGIDHWSAIGMNPKEAGSDTKRGTQSVTLQRRDSMWATTTGC